jgi:hypothetical protein
MYSSNLSVSDALTVSGESTFSSNVSMASNLNVLGALSANTLSIGGFLFTINPDDATKLQINFGGSNVLEISLE